MTDDELKRLREAVTNLICPWRFEYLGGGFVASRGPITDSERIVIEDHVKAYAERGRTVEGVETLANSREAEAKHEAKQEALAKARNL